MNWSYFNKFEGITDKYMQPTGEGETKASQLVTAINKLVYKWYNDGDVYDNTYYLNGWWNDLSSYANWIYENYPDSHATLDSISEAHSEHGYELILKQLADIFLKEPFLTEENKKSAVGSIYDCEGIFKFEYYEEEEYEEY